MSEKFSIIATSSRNLKNVLTENQFSAVFSVTYAESEQDIFKLIDAGFIPNALFIDRDFLKSDVRDFFQQIENHTSVQEALQSDFISKIPVLLFADGISEEDEIRLLEAGASELYRYSDPHSILFHRIKNKLSLYRTEIQRYKAQNDQQKTTIQNLLCISKKTGIYNFRAFLQKTQEMLDSNINKEYTFMRFDLDRFKIFNDLFGFDEGDRILAGIGKIFMTSYNSDKITYGHIYADHFIACFEKHNLNPAQLSQELTDYVNGLHPQFDFIVRIGFCDVLNDGNIDISLVCDHAQLALQSIKTDFTERYAFFNPEMVSELKQEQELITDMVSGILNEEFQVYLQPQYDYTTDTLIGAEALVRWLHPKKGLINPSVFIPIFERNGFITQLDEYIWDRTCRMLRAWIDEGLNPVPVSVNISRRDIYSQNLIKIFDDLLEKYHLNARLLRLEITESAYMDNPSQLIMVVETLRNHGFCLEMDDFGSGYSSLNTLKDVPVDVLKLDMKFISAATEGLTKKDVSESSSRSGSILSSVVRMANWLRLPIIAEGIESKEQADYLKSIGCFHMQGFYFAKPMPADEYKQLLVDLPAIPLEQMSASDIHNALNFIDSDTQDALLFNNFVGGAAIVEWTGDSVNIIRVNDKFLEELNTTIEDYKPFKRNILENLEKNDRQTFVSMLAEATRTGKIAFCEIKSLPIYEGTQPFWLRVNGRYLAKTATSDIFYLSIENIDFRMQLLQLNTNLYEQLATIMENVPCGILNLDYNKKFSISYLNETLATMCGYKQSEFRSKMTEDPFMIFSKEQKESVSAFLTDAIQKRLPAFSTKTEITTKDGTQKAVQINGNLLERSDGTLYLNTILIDAND